MRRYYFSINYIDIKFVDNEFHSPLKYEVDHISKDSPNRRRPGYKAEHSTITIHNSNNPSSTARNEHEWLLLEANQGQESYHIIIDDNGAIETIPLDEVTCHCSNNRQAKQANQSSIAIMICESGDYELTLEYASQVIAELLYERSWEVTRLRRHYDWTGNNCPRKMNSDGLWSGWEDFVERVYIKLIKLKLAQYMFQHQCENDVKSIYNYDKWNEAILELLEQTDIEKIIQHLENYAHYVDSEQERNECLRLANAMKRLSDEA